jgi:tetratricopeptide (TPR) repeat protein
MRKLLLFIALVLLPSVLPAQTNNISLPDPPSTKEILEILGSSSKVYTISIIDDTIGIKFPEYKQIGDQYYLKENDSSKSLMQYTLSEIGQLNLTKAEKYYSAREYDSARFFYDEIIKTDSSYSKPYVYIGDIYYLKKDYDSAMIYYKKGVAVNSIDYDAHWFLADAYNKKKDYDSELKELTIAHLLNRNHKELFERLKLGRKHAGKEWNNWAINPVFNISAKSDGGAAIKASEDWLGYALAEALWQYEPGFAEKYQGASYNDQPISYRKEISCLYANGNSKSEEMKKLIKIAEDGYFEQAVWYEVLSRKIPTALLLMPNNVMNKLIEYINKYH